MESHVWAAVLVLGWLAMVVRLRAERRVAARTRTESALLAATWILCLAVTANTAALVAAHPASWRTRGGAVLFLAALAFWRRARHDMGGEFAQTGGLPARLVTAGAFARLRHPMYAATAAATLGHTVAAGPGWRGALLWLALALVLWVRALREEAQLAGAFGPGWQAYARRVPGARGW